MKILLAAPEICTPWTEGRKRFVLDLSYALAPQHTIRAVTTTPPDSSVDFPIEHRYGICRSKLAHLFRLHQMVRRELTEFAPDAVCHFPYGTFRHVYRWANHWSMRRVDQLCQDKNIPCFTIMYSITRETPATVLRDWVANLVLVRLPPVDTDDAIRLGIRLDGWPAPPATRTPAVPARLLFMAGMWQQTVTRLEHVLNVRGLLPLLQAGRELSSRGINLTVAVPLLAADSLREHVRRHPDNSWPNDSLQLEHKANVPNIFSSHDLFVFPYMREETQFIPTSVIEAMAAGIPVVLPTLSFLKGLAGNGERAFLHRPADTGALAHTIIKALSEKANYQRVRTNAVRFVHEQMSIKHSCQDLMQRFQKLSIPGT